MDSRHVGMIGLGLMGTALAERLLEAGYHVHVYNRSREKAVPLIARGATWSDHPLRVCDRVLISLYTTDTVEQVLDQMTADVRRGLILIDTTTGSPQQTAALGLRLSGIGVDYLDAPISGSSEQTRRGEVTSIVGGTPESFAACRDLFDCFSQRTIYAGPCGSGAQMKLVSNLVLGLNRAALAEGLVFAESLGLELKAALEVLMGTMAYSRIMETKGQKMIAQDFRPQARLSQHLKDLRLMLDSAQQSGLQLPLTEVHAQLLRDAEAAGWGDSDNSAVIQAYRRSAKPHPDPTTTHQTE